MSLFDGMFGAGTQSSVIGTQEVSDSYTQHLNAHKEELLRQQYAAQANVYTQQLAQSMMNANQGVLQGAKAAQYKPFNPNEDAAYTTPLSQLVTLWQANYGDKWVEVFEDAFWNSARVRLHNNDKLEGVGGWYRIKEDV